MGKTISKRIMRMDGGMKNDIRDTSPNGARLIKYFDPLTYTQRLQPFRDSESGNDTPLRNISNFAFANSKLFGLGVDTSTGFVKIYNKSTFSDGAWSETTNNSGDAAPQNTNLFVVYTYGGTTYIFGTKGTGASGDIWKYDISGGGFTEADLVLNFTQMGQGLVHSKDDILYVPYSDANGVPKIAKNSAGSWSSTALTLPAGYINNSIFELGNFLGIALAPISSGGRRKSRVMLWDRDSTLTTISDSLDFGEGILRVADELNGNIVGIIANGNKLQVKVATEYRASTVLELTFENNLEATNGLFIKKQIKNNRLYFQMIATLDGVAHYGVWALGKNELGQYALYLDRTPNNDTDPNNLIDFILFDDSSIEYLFFAYFDAAGDEQVSKTTEQDSNTATSIWETLKDDNNQPDLDKKLVGVTILHAPLPDNGQAVVKYKKDEETSFTTILTNTVDDSLSKSAVNIESTGANLPTFREIMFRVEAKTSSGAGQRVDILGLEYTFETIGKKPYGTE